MFNNSKGKYICALDWYQDRWPCHLGWSWTL